MNKFEKETIISYNDGEPFAEIYTASTRTKKRLLSLCESSPEEYKLIREDEYGMFFSCPKNRIRFSKPISQEKKDKLREYALNHNFGKKSTEVEQ